MKTTVLRLLLLVATVSFLSSCSDTEYITEEIVVYEDSYGAFSIVPKQDVNLAPNSESILMEFVVVGFQSGRLSELEANFSTTLTEFLDAFDEIKIVEKNNLVVFEDDSFLDLEDDNSDLDGEINNEYYFTGEEHRFQIIAKRNSTIFSGTRQITITDIDFSVRNIEGDLTIRADYYSNDPYTFILQ
jgi:hypothetical protein